MAVADFKQCVAEAARAVTDMATPVKLVSNLDADGISAAAITSRALTRAGIQHGTRIVHQLDSELLDDLAGEDYDTYVFTDLGSGDLDLVSARLDGDVIVLDHHTPSGNGDGVVHVNPHLYGVDGSGEISAAGVAYFFAQALDDENQDLAHLGVVGAIGDVQEDGGFYGLNEEVVEAGERAGVLAVEQGLSLYGKETRPVYKLLEYSTDLYIPGVTNSQSGAIQFLQSLGIDPKDGSQWRYWSDLSAEEQERLIAGLVMRCDGATVDDVIGDVYRIPHRDGIFGNAREFSTLLNACGRLDKASIGLGACLEKPGFERKALDVRKEYTSEIVDALEWFENAGEEYVRRGDGYVIINAEDNVLNTIIGTVISILAKSGEYAEGTFFLSMARKPDGVTKVSIRVVGEPDGVDLAEIIGDLAEAVGGESGGHEYAAGALIDTVDEERFVEEAVELFEEW